MHKPSPPLERLDDEWHRMGIQGHPDKAMDLSRDAKVLGGELRHGVRLQSRGSRLWNILASSLDLLPMGSASRCEIEVLNGHLCRQNLLNRFLYDVLHNLYDFIRLPHSARVRPVPDLVLSEILLNVDYFRFVRRISSDRGGYRCQLRMLRLRLASDSPRQSATRS